MGYLVNENRSTQQAQAICCDDCGSTQVLCKSSFTHFPPGLVPYSHYPSPVRLLAVKTYVWGIEYISVHGTNPWRDRGNRLSLGEWLERATVAGGCLIWRRPVQWRCRGG